jgi:muconate cycloisomerase
MLEAGATNIKVKIGRDPRDDAARVRAVRETIGPDITIQVDANQGYSASAAMQAMRALQPYDIDLVEQPVPAGDLAGLVAIRRMGMRVMVDESLYTPADMIRVIEAGAADVVMVKTGKHGGLLNSHRICVIAEAAGLTCGIASMGHFVDRAASLHLAGAVRAVQHPNMLAQFFPWTVDTLFRDPLQPDPRQICIPDGPGLGAEVDESKLERYRVASEQ